MRRISGIVLCLRSSGSLKPRYPSAGSMRFITVTKSNTIKPAESSSSCGETNKETKEGSGDEEDLEEMFVQGPHGIEWGGPTRGGKRPEPTRYGDWEYKGRVMDF
jgi:hypothetical protein